MQNSNKIFKHIYNIIEYYVIINSSPRSNLVNLIMVKIRFGEF